MWAEKLDDDTVVELVVLKDFALVVESADEWASSKVDQLEYFLL